MTRKIVQGMLAVGLLGIVGLGVGRLLHQPPRLPFLVSSPSETSWPSA